MKCTSILIAAAIASVLFISCKNSGTTGLPIPKDASIVIHINASSISSKLSWKEIQATEWFKEAYQKEEDSFQKKLMDDPASSGIDTRSDFAFFMQKQGKGNYIVFEGNVKDAAAFEKALKKFHHNAETKKAGDLIYIKAGNDNIVSWNSSKFIFTSGLNFHSGYTGYGNATQDSAGIDSLIKFSKDLYSLSKDNSLESNERFTSLLKETGDIHFWMNMEEYMSSVTSVMGANPMLSMMQGMNSMFKGTIATGALRFDDGKITVTSKKYLNDEMKKIMDKYQYKNITEEEVNRIPSQNVDAAFILNYPPDASKEFLKTMGIDGFINGFLGGYNTNLDEVIQATKGQLIFAVSDLSFSQPKTGTGDKGFLSGKNITVLLALSINNKTSFDKLINIAKEQIKDSAMLSKISFKDNNDWFAFSNVPETVDHFLAGRNSKLPFANKITGHPFGLYVDLQKLTKKFQSNSFSGKMMDSTANIWQDIVATGGDYKNGMVAGEFTVNFVDKNTNSLKQLNQYANAMYRYEKKRGAQYNLNDSTRVTLPPASDSIVKPN